MAPASSSTDEPPTHVVVDCSLTPIEYWSLRDDERYHDFLQSAVDPPVTASVISREEDEDGLITRVAEVTPVKIPYRTRCVQCSAAEMASHSASPKSGGETSLTPTIR